MDRKPVDAIQRPHNNFEGRLVPVSLRPEIPDTELVSVTETLARYLPEGLVFEMLDHQGNVVGYMPSRPEPEATR